MNPTGDVDLLGVFVEPASLCLLVALFVALAIRRALDLIGADRVFWNRALLDLSIIVSTSSLLILSLRLRGS